MYKNIIVGFISLFLTTTVLAHPGGHGEELAQRFKVQRQAAPAQVAQVPTQATAAALPVTGDFIRLVAGLDEPEEFYCFDLAGWGEKLKLDDPLQTHTCKKKGAGDQMFFFDAGQLKVHGFDRCVQVGGSSAVTLPGSAVLARECSDDKLQMLSLEDNGTIRVKDTDFCIGAGFASMPASGPSHMWRTLTVVSCDAEESLTQWQLGLD